MILRDVPVSMILNMIASFPIFLFDFERRFERFRSNWEHCRFDISKIRPRLRFLVLWDFGFGSIVWAQLRGILTFVFGDFFFFFFFFLKFFLFDFNQWSVFITEVSVVSGSDNLFGQGVETAFCLQQDSGLISCLFSELLSKSFVFLFS